MKQLILPLLLLIGFIIVGTIESGDSPTEEDIYNYLVLCDIQHPEVVMKQIKLETGYFTSRIYKDQNNLFGLKYAYNRPTTAYDKNSKNGSAIYHSWKHSVIDYYLYQNKYYKGGDYYSFLAKSYAQDTMYVRKLRLIK